MPLAPDLDIFGKPIFDGKEECLGVRARTEGSDLAEGEGVGKEEDTLSLYRDGESFLRLPTCLVNPLASHSLRLAVRLDYPYPY